MPSTEHMNVQVVDALPSLLSDIGNQSVTIVLQALLPGHLGRNEHQLTHECLVSFVSGRHGHNGLGWNDENVNRSLRLYVSEGNYILVFIDFVGRDFTVDDFLKDGHSFSIPRENRQDKHALFVFWARHHEKAIPSNRDGRIQQFALG